MVVSVTLLNCVLVYCGLNLLLGLVFAFRDARRTNPVSQTYGSQLDAVYPELPEPARTQMLSECWNRPYQYADYVHFQERPCDGQYVNVSEHGYREPGHALPWPPSSEATTVFCFGGSTLFGYGQPDARTIPGQLSRLWNEHGKRPVHVYNFGVGWHYSTQERLRFEQLLRAGHIPDVAIFLDGINDTSLAAADRPPFSSQLSVAFEQIQGMGVQGPQAGTGSGNLSTFLAAAFYQQPLGRLARSLKGRLSPATTATPTPHVIPLTLTQAQAGCRTYRWNRQLIAAAALLRNVPVLFVVQPAPGYNLDRSKHPFAHEDLCRNEDLFYQTLKADLQTTPKSLPGNPQKDRQHILWLADIGTETPGPQYVDTCHYTATFSKTIAERIRDALAQQRWFTSEILPQQD